MSFFINQIYALITLLSTWWFWRCRSGKNYPTKTDWTHLFVYSFML